MAVSLNGQGYAEKAPTITIQQDDKRSVLAGSGFAGCNSWFGRVTLGQKQFGVDEVGTTRMFCREQMKAESGFLDALKSVKQWRMDGKTLVLEGERTTLLLAPAAPDAR